MTAYIVGIVRRVIQAVINSIADSIYLMIRIIGGEVSAIIDEQIEAAAAFLAAAQAMHESQERTIDRLREFWGESWGATPVYSLTEHGPVALICDHCGTMSPGDASFCIGCGQCFERANTGETTKL
jgi:hypothetical protein